MEAGVKESTVSCLARDLTQSPSEIFLSTRVPKRVQAVTWHLPKWGEALYDCGSFFRFEKDDKIQWRACAKSEKTPTYLDEAGREKDHVKASAVKKSCHRAECPICSESWARRLAKKDAERIEQAVKLYRAEKVYLGKFKHFSVSPPQDWAKGLMQTKDGQKELNSAFIKTWIKAGATGGWKTFHPFRKKKCDSCECGVDGGRGRGLVCSLDDRNVGEDDVCKDWKKTGVSPDDDYGEGWYVSPHFHFAGYGFLQKSDEFFAQTGWMYKQIIGEKKKERSKFGTLFYLLTHCGLAYVKNGDRRVFNTVSWLGNLSYNKVSIEKEERVNEQVLCGCGRFIYSYGGDEVKIDWSDKRDVLFIRTVRRTYKLNKKKRKAGVRREPRVRDIIQLPLSPPEIEADLPVAPVSHFVFHAFQGVDPDGSHGKRVEKKSCDNCQSADCAVKGELCDAWNHSGVSVVYVEYASFY